MNHAHDPAHGWAFHFRPTSYGGPVPELPEVEVLARHLGPLLRGRAITRVKVRRALVLGATPVRRLQRTLAGATFQKLARRGKYLLFTLITAKRGEELLVAGHLGMTGRMYLLPAEAKLPKHAAVVVDLGEENFVFEDTRYFGRFTLDLDGIERLGPDPLGDRFTNQFLAEALGGSRQAVKVKLLDQSVVAGMGNIYASESLFRAGIPPTLPASSLTPGQLDRLRSAICEVLAGAIELGISTALHYAATGQRDGVFYFGRSPEAAQAIEERFKVYDRAGLSCRVCGTLVERRVQAARSTYFCPTCQRG